MAERYDVFLSYAHADAEQVHGLAENLHNLGLEVFLDAWEIAPGDVLVHQLDRGLLESRNGILCVTPTALSRPWIREEYAALMTRAVERGNLLVPVLLADADLPPLLANRLYVDLRTADGPEYEKKVRQLAAILKGERPAPPSRTGELRPRPGTAFRAEGTRRGRLRISRSSVAYIDVDGDGEPRTEHQPRGLTSGTEFKLWDLDRARHRPDFQRDAAAAATAAGGSALHARLLEIGEALTREFLDGAAGEVLRREVAEAERLGFPLELGLEIEDDLAALPWETLRLPGPDGTVGPPLALQPGVRLFRAVAGLGSTPALSIPGPLRILVAIGSPEEQNARGELLDMERELSRILDAVEPARKTERPAYVRVIDRGTVRALRDALQTERYHVLHVTCHAGPGVLVLENDDGSEDRVTAQRFCDEVLPHGRGVPLVVLAGCATALGSQGESALPGFALQLLERGVPTVLAMQAPVSDPYATELGARLYGALATFEHPDPLTALAEARRTLEIDRRDGKIPAPVEVDLAEWATPALYLRGPSQRLYDPEGPIEKIQPPAEPRFSKGVVVRRVGEFIGRRREERRILQALRDKDGAGVLLQGIGGVGKSSLAAEVLKALSEDGWLVASVFSRVSPDDLLAEIGQRLLLRFQEDGVDEADPRRRLAGEIRRSKIDWEERFEALAQHLLGERPLILLLDNFEDNLDADFKITNHDLADLLSRWLQSPGDSRLLLTSRHPFELPEEADQIVERLHLGSLSFAETRKLMWRLPGLDALSTEDQLRAYANVGGHPRALEYLDALLRGGKGRFKDITRRLENALKKEEIDPKAWLRGLKGDLDRALAETVTRAADDVLLEDLLARLMDVPLAEDLLIGASVYQVPVDVVGLAWQVGEEVEVPEDPERNERLQRANQIVKEAIQRGEQPAPEILRQAASDLAELRRPPLQVSDDFGPAREALLTLGLLAPVDSGSESHFFVHRWTATALLGRTSIEKKRAAHSRAARYWRWRVEKISNDLEEHLQARFHHRKAEEIDAAVEVTGWVCSQLDTWGAYRREEQLCREVLEWVPEKSPAAANFAHQLGIVSQNRGDYDQALDWYKKSLQIKEELGNRAGMASSYHQLGMVSQNRGAYDEALDWYKKSLQIKENLGNRAGMASSYHELGIVSQSRGAYDEALDWYKKSLQINEDLGNRVGMASSYHQLGRVSQSRGACDEALDWYKKSLQINEDLGNRVGMASSYHQLGIVSQSRGAYDDALDWYKKSLQILEELGNRAGMASSYHQLGMVLQSRGAYADALDWYKKSLQIEEELGNRAGMARTISELGVLSTERGRAEEGVPFNLRSLAIRLQIGSPEAGIDLHWLNRQREILGESRFGEILREHLEEEGGRVALELMERFSKGGEGAPPEGETPVSPEGRTPEEGQTGSAGVPPAD